MGEGVISPAFLEPQRSGQEAAAHDAATFQFHDLILTVVKQMAKLPVIPAPAGVRFQPVDADEVAARLVELAFGAPAGLVPETWLAGVSWGGAGGRSFWRSG